MKKRLFFLFAVLLSACSASLEDQFRKLEEKAKEAIVQQDTKKIIRVLEKLEKLQSHELEGKIQVLEKFSGPKELFTYTTPSRNIFLFGSGENTLHFLYRNRHYVSDLKIPQEVFSSFYGKYWILRFDENARCRDVFYELYEENGIPQFSEKKQYTGKCLPVVLTDTGKIFEVTENNDIINKETGAVVIAEKQFPKLFKKNKSNIHLEPVPDKGFWIFYGNIGYYELFYYDEKRMKPVYKGVALPKVYYALEDLFQEPVMSENYYFVFTGGAGQYSLTGFRLPEEVWKSFNIDYKEKYVYIVRQDFFLFSEDNSLFLLNPKTSKEIQLPIYLFDYFVYNNSLIFLTERGLFVRKEPFSDLERKIFYLREELVYNIK